MESRTIGVHNAPIWRKKTDYIFMAKVDDYEGMAQEQLWGRRVGENSFEVCCIPFFIYDLALGDIVEIDEASWLKRVVERSGRAVYRAWFGSVLPAGQLEVIAEVERLGGIVERSSDHLVAIDAATKARAHAVLGALSAFQERNLVTFEVGSAQGTPRATSSPTLPM